MISNMEPTRNIWPNVLAGIVLALAVMTAAFGATGHSLNGYHDASFFIPPAINWAMGDGLMNPLTDTRTSWGDPTGADRYLYFPPLLQLVVGTLISPSFAMPLPQQAMTVMGFFAAAVALLAGTFFFRVATSGGTPLTGYGVLLITASLCIILRSVWNNMARPENLEAVLLLIVCLIVLAAKRERTVLAACGVAVGLMPAIHPFGAMFSPLLVGLYISFRYPWREALTKLAMVAGIALMTYLLVMQFSPYSIAETLQGVSRHADLEVAKIELRNAAAFLKSTYALSYAVVGVFLAFAAFRLFVRIRGEIRSLPLFLLFAAALAGLLVKMVFMGTKTYYATLFALIVFAFIVRYLTQGALPRWARYGALAFLVLFALISLKTVFAFPAYLERGMGIAEAREEFAPILAQYPSDEVFVAGNLWVISEEYSRMHYSGDVLPLVVLPERRLMVLDRTYLRGENGSEVAIPQEAEGCALIVDHLTRGVPRILGVQLTNTMPGYGFAAYECGGAGAED